VTISEICCAVTPLSRAWPTQAGKGAGTKGTTGSAARQRENIHRIAVSCPTQSFDNGRRNGEEAIPVRRNDAYPGIKADWHRIGDERGRWRFSALGDTTGQGNQACQKKN